MVRWSGSKVKKHRSSNLNSPLNLKMTDCESQLCAARSRGYELPESYEEHHSNDR